MTYAIKGTKIFFPINRTHIIDISPGDIISVEGFPGASYSWTDHDAEFMENNPDDEIYLQMDRAGEGQYRVIRVVFELPEGNPAPESDN